jgi:hypothetical protein
MTFIEKDEKLQDEIRRALWLRVNINTRLEDGVAFMGFGPDDRIYPELVISAEEIKARTGREKLRDCVLSDYKVKLEGNWVRVDLLDASGMKGLRIAVVPMRVAKNCFSSLENLQKANSSDLDNDPELETPWYE